LNYLLLPFRLNFQSVDPDVGDQCFKAPQCNFKSKYRTMDGSCNNINFPTWGKAGTNFIRMAAGRYTNGKLTVITYSLFSLVDKLENRLFCEIGLQTFNVF